jgi:anaphase-promoting complex subunit 1
MVMAGSCDVESFRQLRIARKRMETEMHYGYNLAVNQAMGFLFLGSGTYTFNRTPLGLAALLISTYPIFPSVPTDNRFHLQALRHFYLFAMETRLLQARDIDTGRFVSLDLNVRVRDEATGNI